MNNEDCLLANSIKIYPHIAALDLAVKNIISRLPVHVLLVYFVDLVDRRALPLLAKQFDVLGAKGMMLAKTEQEQRNIIKRAIEIKKYSGTIWAIRQAMRSIGFTDAIIEEHVDGHWAKFRITLQNENKGISENTISELITIINTYKNARSLLVDVRMDIFLYDEMNLFDDSVLNEEWTNTDEISFSNSVLYDGLNMYNHSVDHSGDSDLVSFENF